MSNNDLLKAVSESFAEFLDSGSSRSTAKLHPLHGAIANDIANMLPGYKVHAQGYGNGKESTISGRYIDKKVDIVIEKDGKVYGGVGIKFVMQNYSQNSNNYFENMLGETANIRCANYPYFQIFIILDKLPYYDKKGIIKNWETFTHHNVEKYLLLSQDNIDAFYHTPNKTLIFVVHIPDNQDLKNKAEYLDFYKAHTGSLIISDNSYGEFGSAVIINDYPKFLDKVFHTIKAI